jgi:hypothetical protein
MISQLDALIEILTDCAYTKGASERKEWIESKIGREAAFRDILVEILKNIQIVLHQ